MKMLLSSCLALCASVVSAESFVGADVHAQLKGAVDGARVIAQATMPPPGSTVLPRAVTAEGLVGEWEVMNFEALDAQGSRLYVSYADPSEALGEISHNGSLTPSPFAVPYTARATHSYSMTNGRRVFKQTPVKTDSVGQSLSLLKPNTETEALWDARANTIVYSDASGGRSQNFIAVYTGPTMLRMTATAATGARITINLRRTAP